jgi:hypothetical protein
MPSARVPAPAFPLALALAAMGVAACHDESAGGKTAVSRGTGGIAAASGGAGGSGPEPGSGGVPGAGGAPGTGGTPGGTGGVTPPTPPGTGGTPNPVTGSGGAGRGGAPGGSGGSPPPPPPGTGGVMPVPPGTGGMGPADAAPADTQPPPPPPDAASACKMEELSPPNDGAAHAMLCGPLQHRTSPPSSGTHYATWAFFRAYDKPVPWGFLLHAMEHGAVVIAYNCPAGCATEVAAAKALMESIPRKSACPKPRPPVIVVPDPTLQTRFAAAAWGHIVRGDCFDRDTVARFITAHLNMGPEFFPNDCGAVDREEMGWCP